MSRWFLATVAVGFLGGCNMVVTDAPMFSAADGAGAPALRAGVWRIEDAACAFDEHVPENKWPACAHASPPLAETPPWLAVAGEPPLLQMPLPMPTTKGRSLAIRYVYMAYRPLKLDDRGRALSMNSWFVECGPPPPPQAAPAKLDPGAKDLSALSGIGLTTAPFPGLTLRKDMADCTAESPAALRGAAKASEGLQGSPHVSHWVRDPIVGDQPPLSKDALTALLKQPA
jgi:hypothetical protein